MYNEIQKQRFIQEYTSSAKTTSLIVQIFSWFEEYESAWGLDLSRQTAELLQPVVNEITGVRIKSTELVLIILREYVKWCDKNGYNVSNGIFDVKINTIDKIKIQMVASPLHLKSKLDEHFDEADVESVDITYRVFLWMAFSGMISEDAIRVERKHVDLENLTINFENHSYEIYKECIKDFQKACCLTDFFYEHENPYYAIRRDRADGALIMRGIRSPAVDLKIIRPVINKKLSTGAEIDHSGQKSVISYNRVRLSGVFYRAYERERAGLPVDFSEARAREIEQKENKKKYTITKTRTLTTIANRYEREYIADYERWKCAFAI